MGKAINIANSTVSAKDDAYIYNASFYNKNGVIEWGNNLDYNLESNNLIKIKDGMAVVNGRIYVVYNGTEDELNISTGSQGVSRIDYVVLEFDATNETLTTKIIEGVPSANPVAPTLIQQDTLKGGSKYQMPLYRINIEGISISTIDDLRAYASFDENALINKIYPVGSIYMSVNSANPSTFIGGIWERLKDRFLLGAGDTYTAGATGGEASHTLTEAEMPSHNHSIPSLSGTASSAGGHTHSIPSLSGSTNGVGDHSHSYSAPANHTHGLGSGWANINVVPGGNTFSASKSASASFNRVINSGSSWCGEFSSGEATSLGGTTDSGGASQSASTTGSGAHSHSVSTNASDTGSNGSHTHSLSTNASTTGSKGSGTAHNNMPPYLAVYMWKRIA